MKDFIGLWIIMLFVSCGSGTSADTQTVSSNTQTTQGDLNLQVTINGAPNQEAKLLGIYEEQYFQIDTSRSDANGKFIFQRDTLLPTGAYFVLLTADNTHFQILIDKEDHHGKLETTKGNIVKSFKAVDSPNNVLLYENLSYEADLDKEFKAVQAKMEAADAASMEYKLLEKENDALVKKREDHIQTFVDNHPNRFFTRFKVTGQNPKLKKPLLDNGEVDKELQVYHYRQEFWDNMDFSKSEMLRTPVYFNKLKTYVKDITPQMPDSVIKYADILMAKTKGNKDLFKYTANFIALQYRKPTTMGMEAVFVHMVDKYWTADQAFWSNPEEIKGLRGEISLMKPSLLGKTGQDLRGKNENDQYISMYDIKEPIIVLYIFSYECENCKKESVKLVQFAQEWKNKGVGIFTLSLNDDKEQWKNYLRSNRMNFKNIFDPDRESNYHLKYHIDDTPEMYVLNKDRKIIASNMKTEQLETIIEREREENPW